MSLVGLRSAIVSSIDSSVSAFRTVQPHGGRFDGAELKRIAVGSPACLVAILGGDLTREGGQAVGDMDVFAFIVTRGTSAEKRDESALVLAEAVAGLVSANEWAYADAKAPTDMAIANLYSGEIDRQGIALWAVSWKQMTDLAIFDVEGSLDDFNSLYVDYDLVPADGVIDMTDGIWLNGEFMSAYGHLYVSTPAAGTMAATDTYQKAAGVTTLKQASDFDMPLDNRLRHTGTAAKPILVTASASVTVSADAKVTFALAEGGVVDANTEVEEEMTSAGGAEAIHLTGIFNLAENGYVELWVKADDTIDVTVSKCNLVAAAT